MSDDPARVPTNLRMLMIVEILGKAGGARTPSEINRSLGLPKASIHRLCQTLVDESYLVYDESGKKLRPARRLRQIASGLFSSSHIHIARHQVLKQISRATRETVNFVVPEDDGMRYLDRVEADWALRIQLPIGSHVPFHCTASGKTFLASLKPSKRTAFIASLALERKTGKTLDTVARLLTEIEKVAKQGFAVDSEEFMDGMVAIAMPLFDPNKHYAGALAIHGPTQRLSMDVLLGHLDCLKEGIAKLTAVSFEN